MPTEANAQLQGLTEALHALRADSMRPQAFASLARSQTALLQALPPRYSEVLNHLLDRLESSALFSEESCSFSQRDLLDSLQQWCEQAQAKLPPAD